MTCLVAGLASARVRGPAAHGQAVRGCRETAWRLEGTVGRRSPVDAGPPVAGGGADLRLKVLRRRSQCGVRKPRVWCGPGLASLRLPVSHFGRTLADEGTHHPVGRTTSAPQDYRADGAARARGGRRCRG